ncbi:hypothetical protein ABIA38_007588 [Embleya sp. AB8]
MTYQFGWTQNRSAHTVGGERDRQDERLGLLVREWVDGVDAETVALAPPPALVRRVRLPLRLRLLRWWRARRLSVRFRALRSDGRDGRDGR